MISSYQSLSQYFKRWSQVKRYCHHIMLIFSIRLSIWYKKFSFIFTFQHYFIDFTYVNVICAKFAFLCIPYISWGDGFLRLDNERPISIRNGYFCTLSVHSKMALNIALFLHCYSRHILVSYHCLKVAFSFLDPHPLLHS